MHYLKKLSIKHIIWLGSIGQFLLTLIITLIALNSLSNINHMVFPANQPSMENIQTASTGIIILLTMSLLVSLAIAYFSSKFICHIITDINNSIKNMSRGQLNTALNEQRLGEAGQIAKNFNVFSTNMHSMVSNIQSAIRELESASSEMSIATTETSTHIQQQQLETEQLATAARQMTATAQEIASNAARAEESAKYAQTEAQNGALASTEAMAGMGNLVADLNRSSDVISTLKIESENIGVVLDVIRGISEQTNLLALNAAIEAARAGEQGRGFAVVADEVRTLASRTQDSTDQIRELIEKLQAGTSNAVKAMDNAIRDVAINNDQVERTAESLGCIAGAVSQINQVLTQMATSSEQQCSASQEISRSITSINSLVEKTSLSSDHTQSAESNLNNSALLLNQQINNLTG